MKVDIDIQEDIDIDIKSEPDNYTSCSVKLEHLTDGFLTILENIKIDTNTQEDVVKHIKSEMDDFKPCCVKLERISDSFLTTGNHTQLTRLSVSTITTLVRRSRTKTELRQEVNRKVTPTKRVDRIRGCSAHFPLPSKTFWYFWRRHDDSSTVTLPPLPHIHSHSDDLDRDLSAHRTSPLDVDQGPPRAGTFPRLTDEKHPTGRGRKPLENINCYDIGSCWVEGIRGMSHSHPPSTFIVLCQKQEYVKELNFYVVALGGRDYGSRIGDAWREKYWTFQKDISTSTLNGRSPFGCCPTQSYQLDSYAKLGCLRKG
uniref:Uncharacterized protein n=1 Tax=Timema douglasi TaxID=61478 RepID=A0A7R8Z9A9_TIMDO|nr:unnamed protein product [Timema douglasi]